MPVKFPEFDMSEFEQQESTIAHDLDIVNNEIIEKSSPFVNAPAKKKVYKPLPPSQEVDLDERVFKENKEIEKEQKKERKKKTLSENWLKNMSKFENVMKKMESEKQKKLQAQQKQEQALEQKYRKKFELEQKAKQEHQKKIRPHKTGTIAQPDPPINFNPLQQQETNPYDKYFDF